MCENGLYKAQHLLYCWISNFEKRRYAQIKEVCGYLNDAMNLNLGEHPWVGIFYPLIYSGVIDHVGKGYYALTRPLTIDYENHLLLINKPGADSPDPNLPIGWRLAEKENSVGLDEAIRLNSYFVLKSFPSIDKVVDSWDSSLQDVNELSYHDYRNKIGVAEYKKDGFVRYFSIPEKMYLKEIPSGETNPDAYRIGICLERALNGQGNGFYLKKTKQLVVNKFAFPIMLYRALLLDGMAAKRTPSIQDEFIVFWNISMSVARETNRILCKSIVYE